MNNDFYVYVYFRLDGRPCYVGKGRGRRFKRHLRNCQNPHLASILKSANQEIPCIFTRENISEIEAFETEKALIAAIGREVDGGPLVNLTDGGDGFSGGRHTPESRQKIAAAVSSRPRTLQERQKLSKALRESEAFKIAILRNAQKRRGSKKTAEQIEKTRVKLLGKKRGPMEASRKAKISLANKLAWQRRREAGVENRDNRVVSETTREKLRKINFGRQITQEAKDKIRQSAGVRHAFGKTWYVTPSGTLYRDFSPRSACDQRGRKFRP